MTEGDISLMSRDHRSKAPCNRIGSQARGVPVKGRLDMSNTTSKTTLRKEPLELQVAEIGGLNTDLKIVCLDEPMPGNNACHLYQIEVGPVPAVNLNFQRGPVKQHGLNGISNEALLMIVAHRFEGFQRGEFKSDDNQEALDHIYAALGAMAKRTQGRVLAQVEGYDKHANSG